MIKGINITLSEQEQARLDRFLKGNPCLKLATLVKVQLMNTITKWEENNGK